MRKERCSGSATVRMSGDEEGAAMTADRPLEEDDDGRKTGEVRTTVADRRWKQQIYDGSSRLAMRKERRSRSMIVRMIGNEEGAATWKEWRAALRVRCGCGRADKMGVWAHLNPNLAQCQFGPA
ncbi:hypothetical protein ACLOJK_036891 [Asimina triloba]